MNFCVKLLSMLLILVMLTATVVSCMPQSSTKPSVQGGTTANGTTTGGITVLPPDDDNKEDNNGNNNFVGGVVVGNATAPYVGDVHVSAGVTPDENNQVPSEGVNLESATASATIPGGVQMEEGATELALTINGIKDSAADVVLSDTDVSTSLDVHVSGVAAGNLVPMEVKLLAAALKGLNSTSITLYHVENGETIAMTYVPNDEPFTAHNQFKYDPATGDITLYIASFSEIMMVSDTNNAWEGGVDHSWYDADATELVIANAEQLWSFSQIVGNMAEGIEQDSFSGKTVTLISDINLGDKESENNENIIFYPIGYWNNEGTYERKPVEERETAVESGFYSFCGTFDGNGHTIANFYQNTWEMKGDHNWYDPIKEQYYRDGMGLFGKIYKGTVKNLTVSNFSSDGEITTTGVIAAYADGAEFENIAIFDCNPRVYNIGNGGIVGCVGWYAKDAGLTTEFTNITVDNTNKISALWGSYDVACGGIVGQYYPTSGQTSAGTPKNGGIEFTNCHVSAQMDVYNDVCANYQYYAYRYTGMLIGSVRENVTGEDGRVYPDMTSITASGCTVHYGDWNDYYYCELVANTTASYTHDHQMSRLTQVASVDVENMTVTDLDGNTTPIPTSGRYNYVVVKAKGDDGKWIHGDGHDYATCYHFVEGIQHFHDVADTDNPEIYEMVDGVQTLKEDKQLIYREFNNLVTGYGWGVTTKGVEDVDGVVILDREVGDSIDKFVGTEDQNALKPLTGSTINIGTLFSAKDGIEVDLNTKTIIVSVTPLGENSSVRGTYEINESDWTLGTLTFEGIGLAKVTITDYYFCNPTSVTIDVQPIDKFTSKFTNTKFTYRVGNQNTISLGSLFASLTNLNVPVDSATVAIEANGGAFTPNTTDWTKGTIDFNGFLGTTTITIKDATSTECSVTVEVINAVNATSATSATSNNVVLLQDCGFGSLTVSDGYTLSGNGFTMTCGSDSYALDMGYAFVNLDNGTLDNIQIVCPNFDYAVLYKSNMTESGNRSYTDDAGKTRYYNVKSGVMVSGNSQILNSRISGARAAVNVASGNCIIDNSRIEGGAVASLLVGSANSVTLRDVTLVQKPTESTYKTTNAETGKLEGKTLMGFSVLMVCNSDGDAAPITLEGTLVQNAWVSEDEKQYVPSAGQSIISLVLAKTDYLHDIDKDDINESVNLGFAFIPEEQFGNINATSIADNDNRTNKSTVLYELTSITAVSNTYAYVYSYKNTNGTLNEFINTDNYIPNKNSDIITLEYNDKADGIDTDASFGVDGWIYELNIDLDKLSGYSIDCSKLTLSVNGVAIENYTINGNTKPNSLAVVAGGTTYTLSATVNSKTYTTYLKVTGTETTKDSPSFVAQNYEAAILVGEAGNTLTKDTWHGAAPVLKGIQIRYWSVAEKQYKTISLADYTPTGSGKINGTNTTWTFAPDNGDFTLTITGGQVHSSNNVSAMPVVVNNTLYFVAASSNGLVNYGNSARTIPVTYSFKDNNGGTELTFSHTWSIECADKATAYDYSDFCNGTSKTFTIKSSNGNTCVTGDTLVMLADGSQKRIDEVTYDDMLLVWNFYTGNYDVVPAAIIFYHEDDDYEILTLHFEDGTSVKVINNHGFFDVEANQFVFIDKYNVEGLIGHEFVKVDGNSGRTEVALVGYEIVKEYTGSYSIQTALHINFMVEGMFSLTIPPMDGWFDYFEIGEGMKYDEEKMQADIEKYGLYTYEDFAEYVTYEQFIAFNGPYLKVLVGRGVLTFEEILELIATYVA